MSISLIPLLLIVALAVVLPTFIVLALAFAAIKRKNWGGLAVLGVVLFALPAAWLLAGVSVTHQQDVRAEAEAKAADLRKLAIQTAIQSARSTKFDPTTSTASTAPPSSAFVELINEHYGLPSNSTSAAVEAEVASDEELASIASAPPKIELDSEIIIGDKAADVKSDRPDWIDAHLGDNQKLITSGPFTTKESCELDTQKLISEWLWSRHEELWPSSAGKFPGFGPDVTQAIKSQHEELRDTSVGEMHILYTLAEVTPEVEAQIAQSLANAAAQVAQKRGVRTVTFAGAGVLSLVALTHVVLRSGGRKAKNSAP